MSDRDLTTPRYQVFGDVECGTICRVCGRKVEDGRRKTCGDYCQQILESVMSLLNWDGVRRRVLERDDHTCVECGFRQAWLNRGYEHLQAIVESKLPEEPESPSILRIGKGEVSDEELARAREQGQEWRDRKKELIREWYREPEWRLTWVPCPDSHLEVDHITPLSEDGHPFDPANLRTLCRDCHARKTARENSERAEREKQERPEIKLIEFSEGES